MNNFGSLILILLGFVIIATASGRIAELFQKIKLPLITGFLIVGIISGPHVANLVHLSTLKELHFINNISLGFIAFAAGAELYLRDMRSRFKSIIWMTFGQLVVTFLISTIALFYISGYVHFMANMPAENRLAVSMLIACIFVARSPASAIAIINELRAKGPFTQTAIGVTVVKDVLVIILFAFTFAVAGILINNVAFESSIVVLLFAEISGSFIIGWLLGKLLAFIFSIKMSRYFKIFILLMLGWGMYGFAALIKHWSIKYLSHELYFEPLLINIIASFYITNRSKHRLEFLKMIEETGLWVYIAFFTLTGATISLDVLSNYWFLALIFFGGF